MSKLVDLGGPSKKRGRSQDGGGAIGRSRVQEEGEKRKVGYESSTPVVSMETKARLEVGRRRRAVASSASSLHRAHDSVAITPLPGSYRFDENNGNLK